MRLATPLAIALLAAVSAAGCGASSEESSQGGGAPASVGASARGCDTHAVDAGGLRVTGVSCGEGRGVMLGWQRAEGCGPIGGGSRSACSVRSYRCLGTKTDRGVSVSCARPGRSIAFLAN